MLPTVIYINYPQAGVEALLRGGAWKLGYNIGVAWKPGGVIAVV